MFKKKCACGKAEKNFHLDIGPFYVGDCCTEAGYDDLGKPKTNQPKISPNQTEVSTSEQLKPGNADKLLEFFGVKTKPGRGKLMDTNVPTLKEMAKAKGIENFDSMTKRQLVEALLK